MTVRCVQKFEEGFEYYRPIHQTRKKQKQAKRILDTLSLLPSPDNYFHDFILFEWKKNYQAQSIMHQAHCTLN